MLRSFKQDYKIGISSELTNKPIFENHFKESFNKLSQSHIMDFESDNKYLEIKTRTNNYNRYPTTMIPYNKIEFAKKSNKEVYFIFVFTDSIYYIKYDNNFDNFEKKLYKRDDRIDYTDKEKDYIYIPITFLSPINK